MKNNTKYTNTNESMHSEMGPVRRNPIQRTVRTAHTSKCAYDCAQLQYTIHHRTVLIISPSYLRSWQRTNCHNTMMMAVTITTTTTMTMMMMMMMMMIKVIILGCFLASVSWFFF